MSLSAEAVTTSAEQPAQPTAGPARRVLIVEDDDLAGRQLCRILQDDPGLEVVLVKEGQAALDELALRRYSVLITDLRMPGMDGMDLIREVKDREIPVTVIVMTAYGSIDEAVQAIRMGAYDFLTKPINVDNLKLLIARALRERSLEDEVTYLRAQLQDRYRFQHILSKNAKMHAIFDLINRIAPTTTTVLIEGETGTGKEQLARAIHAASTRSAGPLVAINCAAVPETLLESELFGHEKGSFTGAVAQRKGRFEQADGGTLFLDEIGDVPGMMQVKLLRVLQERRFERVGGTQSIEVDVRIVAATNRSLKRLVRKGTFREDLYYRLNVIRIELPPLRERQEDIPLLVAHFAQKFARPGEPPREFSPAAMERLLNHSWPGNIRELENVVERACVTTNKPVVEADHLPLDLGHAAPPPQPCSIDLKRPLRQLLDEAVATIEQQYIQRALKRTRGHVGKCAKLCGYSRRSITAKISEYGLDRTQFRRED